MSVSLSSIRLSTIQRLGLSCLCFALVYSHFVCWGLSHHRTIQAAINDTIIRKALIAKYGPPHTNPITVPHVSPQSRVVNYIPVPALLSHELDEPLDLLSMPVVFPFTASGNIESSDGVAPVIPASQVSIVLASLVIIVLWDRFLRGQKAQPERYDDTLKCLNLSLLVLLPVPLLIAVYTYFVTQAPDFMVPPVNLPIMAVLMACLFGIYPLVFFHIRWRRIAKRGQDMGFCHRCGYPLDALPRCPECGTDRGANPTGRLSRRRRRVLVAGYAAVPLVLVGPFWLSWIDMGFAWLRSVV